MTSWTAICRVDDIPVLGSRRVQRAKGLPVALFRTSTGQVFLDADELATRALDLPAPVAGPCAKSAA